MKQVRTHERNILELERFKVIMTTEEGTDLKAHKRIGGAYDYGKAAPEAYTVSEWKRKKFNECFAGFDVIVLNGNGERVRGNTLLKNVRATYNE